MRGIPLVGRVPRLVVVTAALLAFALGRGGDAAAAPWCGSVSDADRPTALLAGPVVRVLYAIPVDGPDNSSATAPRIAAELDEVDAWWRREDSSRTLRFDTYADACGTQYDVTRLRLAGVGSGQRDNGVLFRALADVVQALPSARTTKYLVYYDGPATPNVCGTGGGNTDGIGLAVVFLQSCAGIGTAQVGVHELLHAFGLADETTPHACPGDPGHVCDSTGDVLYVYAQPVSLASFELDVGHDDYYAHPGSWFDLQESPWLVRVSEQATLSLSIAGTGSVASDVPGLSCTAACTRSWNAGSAVTLTAEPGPGQRFVRWSGGCTGVTDCRLQLAGPTAVSALFAPARFRLSLSATGRGTVTAGAVGLVATGARPRTARLVSYEPVRLVARPAKGWRFRGWTGAARGTRPVVTVPMTRDAAVRAVFVRLR